MLHDLNIPRKKYTRKYTRGSRNMHLTLSLKSLKTGNSLMKNYYLVPEGHQCPGSFQEVEKIFQISEIAAVIYFQK